MDIDVIQISRVLDGKEKDVLNFFLVSSKACDQLHPRMSVFSNGVTKWLKPFLPLVTLLFNDLLL